MKSQVTYHEAMQKVDKFCKLAEQNQGIHYAYGFLQSFSANCLSGRSIDISLKVLDAAIEDLQSVHTDTTTDPGPSH